MEAISSANDRFHLPKFSQVSPKLSSKMPSRKFGGLQFLIRQRKSFLPWHLILRTWLLYSFSCSFFLIRLELKWPIRSCTPVFPRKPSPNSDDNWQSLYAFQDQNGAKPVPLGAAHTYDANIKEYPPPPPGEADTVQVVALKIKLTHVSANVRRRGVF